MSDDARTLELVSADEHARQVVQTLFDRPLVLEAGAGTGKTASLVARVVTWSLGPGWERAEQALRSAPEKTRRQAQFLEKQLSDRKGSCNAPEASPAERAEASRPERIAARVLGRMVAITFTEAAAAEMSERIGEALQQVSEGGLPLGIGEAFLPAEAEVRRERGAALRGALDHLVVQTIHAYCRRLLTAHPIEAGLHPRLEVDADGALQREVARELLVEKLAVAYARGGDPSYLELAKRGGGPRSLEEQLIACAKAGLTSAAVSPDPLADAPVGALFDRVGAALTAFREAADGRLYEVARSTKPGETAKLVDTTLAQLEALRAEPAGPRRRAALDDLVAFVQERWSEEGRALKRVSEWARGNFTQGESKALGFRTERVADAAAQLAGLIAHLRRLDLALLELARPVLCELLGELERRMRARGVATFTALLADARELLRRHPEVAARVRAGIDQLLVDEFQDTDQCQCDIIAAIALSGPVEARPGLLLVGDPKQSIYGWRNADLAAYDAFVQGVLDAGGVRERLSVNYRSVPAILQEVERVIEPAMQECVGLQPAFQPLVACASNRELQEGAASRSTGIHPVEYWVSASWDAEANEPRRSTAAEANELEARALARDLRSLHDAHGVAWGKIGILFRSRTDWEVYVSALRAARVPHVVEGDRHYYRRREIIEAAALVRCVVDPNDHVALLTWLRSAAVGVPDAALLPLWARGLPERMGALYGADAPGLAALCDDVACVARELPAAVPGLSRVEGWHHNLIDAISWLGPLRACFDREPGDVFVERLRTASLFEASEAARYLGAWRSANLERFFAELAAALAGEGGASAVLRGLRRSVAEQEEASEARPVGSAGDPQRGDSTEIDVRAAGDPQRGDSTEIDVRAGGDSVRVMTWHGAKGLDFEHVYLMQLHKGSDAKASQDDCAGEYGGRAEYRLFGAATLGWDGVLAAAARVAEAEQVRMLYVAMTRAKRRLVLAGQWPAFQRQGRGAQAVALLRQRQGGVPDLEAEMRGLAAREEASLDDGSGAVWTFPALLPAAARADEEAAEPGPPAVSARRVAEAARQLRHAGEAAAQRMRRSVGGRASAAGHARIWDAPGADGEPAPRLEAAEAALTGNVARCVGTAIHRVLEELDLEAEPEAALADAGALLAQWLGAELRGVELESALEAAGALLRKISNGVLLRRLFELGPHIVARELPVLLPPEAPSSDGAMPHPTPHPDGELAPVGFVAGAIDLVYRDPEGGELVIADYKTDRLGNAELEAAGRRYAAQGEAYRRALREALGLDYTPRFELWFLSLDRMLEL